MLYRGQAFARVNDRRYPMYIVKIAVLRNETDRLFRLANTHYHACVGVIEVQIWQTVARRALADTEPLTCKRATPYDLQQWAEAVNGLTATLAASADRIERIKSQKPSPRALRLVEACELYSQNDRMH